MDQLKRELTEHANEHLWKQMCLENPPTFQKKTHEIQTHFNEEVQSKVVDAVEALSQTPASVEKAKSLLEEGEKLLAKRQNLYVLQISMGTGGPQ